ncbi:hypothetical protein M3G47_05195 [Corynebacterium sanguinis]|uniref:alpha/beta hydrolase n=1 Tax=Corynebacterium sanguinis TaxID=2594913 RepID=UPI0021A2665F|nr:lipase family protein [Corynebacterium sanguinis]MCT1491996.1 hypothetical protein [Corynebacterium sanguinis]MCT2247486.1 hypothetical protein [Corynebacterium sanguinis]
MVDTRLTVLGAAAAAALAYTAYRSRHNARSLRRGAGTTSAAARELAIPESAVGTVLEKEQLDSDRIISAPGGSATFLVRYGSRNAHGEPIAATGLVTLPRGDAPEGGWPVLSWAHGTTGLSKRAAPSTALDTHPDEETLVLAARDYLQPWLDKGFAVIQPDYEGLGTVGSGTYTDRHSLASAVNEMVRATRGEFSFGETWYNTGWSQGGFAAVAAASADDVPSGLRRTLAIAPGDSYVPKTPVPSVNSLLVKKVIGTIDAEHLTYVAYAVQGAANFNSAILPDDLFNDRGKEPMRLASSECLTTFKEVSSISGEEIFKDRPDVEALLEHFSSNSMVNMRPVQPVTIFISKDDDIIDYRQISVAARRLALVPGCDVEVVTHSGPSHRDMVRRAVADQKPYVPEL